MNRMRKRTRLSKLLLLCCLAFQSHSEFATTIKDLKLWSVTLQEQRTNPSPHPTGKKNKRKGKVPELAVLYSHPSE